jgi:hypothetical protein
LLLLKDGETINNYDGPRSLKDLLAFASDPKPDAKMANKVDEMKKEMQKMQNELERAKREHQKLNQEITSLKGQLGGKMSLLQQSSTPLFVCVMFGLCLLGGVAAYKKYQLSAFKLPDYSE